MDQSENLFTLLSLEGLLVGNIFRGTYFFRNIPLGNDKVALENDRYEIHYLQIQF